MGTMNRADQQSAGEGAKRGEHTPGPWRVEGPDCFCDYNILPPEDGAGALGAVVNNGRPPEVVAANARLFGAAPDLYKALADIIAAIDREHGGELGVDTAAAANRASAALAKART